MGQSSLGTALGEPDQEQTGLQKQQHRVSCRTFQIKEHNGLLDREELVQNALDSLQGGVEAAYHFPLTQDVPQLATYNACIEQLSTTSLVDECARVCERLATNTDGEIMMGAGFQIIQTRIINSAGTDVAMTHSGYGAFSQIIFPGSGTGIIRSVSHTRFEPMPEQLIQEMIERYKVSSTVVTPKGGKMQILFMPKSAYALTWRIASGTDAKSVYNKISPIAGKIGEQIFHKQLTVYDDALDEAHPWARPVDDEGVACRTCSFVEDGVLKSFFTDLSYAQKLGIPPTGHGYKTQQWGGDPISLKPVPALAHLRIKPGDMTFADLVKSIDRGLILEGVLGAHSGNIPNGDFSVGANPALYVERGEIVGQVKDAMVAGNIYDTLQRVTGIEDTLHHAWGGWMPAIVCDNVSVATKA